MTCRLLQYVSALLELAWIEIVRVDLENVEVLAIESKKNEDCSWNHSSSDPPHQQRQWLFGFY